MGMNNDENMKDQAHRILSSRVTSTIHGCEKSTLLYYYQPRNYQAIVAVLN